jgi:hypothetical protein
MFVLLLCIITCCLAKPSINCIYNDGVNFFDLRPLANGTDYYITMNTYYNIRFNPCDTLHNITEDCPSGTLDCQIANTPDVKQHSMAHIIQPLIWLPSSNNLILEHTRGSFCPAYGTYRHVVIYFMCGTEIGYPVFIEEQRCMYTLAWNSSVACKLDSAPIIRPVLRMTVSIILFITFILFIIFITALIVGYYRRKANKPIVITESTFSNHQKIHPIPNDDKWGYQSIGSTN